ncbi:hypothetical protein YYE_02378 [Plasmodium vinckei vinckei]|nr:hypothetical protein YYE_02378 [Plasmodium vinckei vinckei]
MSIYGNIGLYEKIRRSVFRGRISGPTPLYKTPLRFIWILSFFIDFLLLIKGDEVVSEEEIVASILLTIFFCTVKVIINVFTMYLFFIKYGNIIHTTNLAISKRCNTFVVKSVLINYSILNYFSLGETFLEFILTIFSIIHFKLQVQSYETII